MRKLRQTRTGWMLGSVLAFLLAGCGFHLAGTRPLPSALQKIYIEVVTPYQVVQPPIESALRANLQRRGARVTSRPGEADAVLSLHDLKETREVLSVGVDGKALEYRLVTTVQYSLQSTGDSPRELIEPGELRLTRDYSFQPEQVLAKEAEEARLRHYLQTEMADLLMLRIEARLARTATQIPAEEIAPASSAAPDATSAPATDAPAASADAPPPAPSPMP